MGILFQKFPSWDSRWDAWRWWVVFDRILGLMPRRLFLLGKDYGEGGERQLSIAIWLFYFSSVWAGAAFSILCLSNTPRSSHEPASSPPPV